MNQRIVFTSGGIDVSKDARNFEISRRAMDLRISSEGDYNYWTLFYESEEEARQAFNMVNTLLAEGKPVVYVPGPGFMRKSEEE